MEPFLGDKGASEVVREEGKQFQLPAAFLNTWAVRVLMGPSRRRTSNLPFKENLESSSQEEMEEVGQTQASAPAADDAQCHAQL